MDHNISLIEQQSSHSVIHTLYNIPIHQLRHSKVCQLIQKYEVSRLLDFGCSQGQFLRMAARSPELQLLVGVDIDSAAISKAIENAIPEPIQSSLQFERKADLTIQVYQGNLLQLHPNLKNKDFDMVTLIQVIEHLQLEEVDKACECVFSYLRPKFVVITTPNRQFNVHFNNQDGKLRHWDHKFQWSREQFRSFCAKVQDKYEYQFEITGIGEHIQDQSKGPCTQAAIFTLLQQQNSMKAQSNPCQSQLELKAEYVIECWKSRLQPLMREAFYEGIRFRQNQTFEKLQSQMKNSPLGQCLGKALTKYFLIDFIAQFKDCFRWNEFEYRKATAEEIEEDKQVQESNQLDFSAEPCELQLSLQELGFVPQK